MPAPASFVMNRSNLIPENPSEQHQRHRTGSTGSNSIIQRTYSDPSRSTAQNNNSPPTHTTRNMYDEVFTSRPVTEVKEMLWEIRDFLTVFESRVERAMNFEFEVGRLGSMERHLPRRSRWKILFDSDPCTRAPALRVVQLSPENKTVFYKLQAWIMEGSDSLPERETELIAKSDGFKEGTSDSFAPDHLVPFESPQGTLAGAEFVNKVESYLNEDNLFIKVRMEILEDSSTSSQ